MAGCEVVQGSCIAETSNCNSNCNRDDQDEILEREITITDTRSWIKISNKIKT